MFGRKKEVDFYKTLYQEMLEAKDRYEIAKNNFSNVIPEFFEIANSELTIAKMQYDLCILKLKKFFNFDNRP